MENSKKKDKPVVDLAGFLNKDIVKSKENTEKLVVPGKLNDDLKSSKEKDEKKEGIKKDVSLDKQARAYEKQVLNKKGGNHYENFDNYFLGESATGKKCSLFMPEDLHNTLKTIALNCGEAPLEILVKNIVMDFLIRNENEIDKRMNRKRNEIMKNVF